MAGNGFFNVDAKIKDLFFDRPAVLRAVDRAKLKYLRGAGALTMTIARRSVRTGTARKSAPTAGVTRRRRKAKVRQAQPNKPPFSRTKRFRKSILFHYDAATNSMVVGPEKLNEDPSPRAFEEGGTYPIWVRIPKGQGRPAQKIRTRGTYRKFPTMQPALAIAEPRLPKLWQDTVTARAA
jgi:hypothetical protein